MPIAPKDIFYHVLRREGKWIGKLNRAADFRVGGQDWGEMHTLAFDCELRNGWLRVNSGSKWDFATGAIDTEDMRQASLVHDAYCNMYNAGKITWKARRRGDTIFRKVLKEKGCSFFRRWYAYAAVTVHSYIGKK